MSLYPASLYACARLRRRASGSLREVRPKPPPEKLLQIIWLHQRLLRDRLTTLDGRRVRVLHPGFLNLEAGPDFHAAVLGFDDDPPRSGDVEIDLQPGGWRSHGHDRSPDFRNVLLHVIWDGARSDAVQIPTLALKDVLDSPLSELSEWLGGDSGKELPESSRGKCCAPLNDLTGAQLEEVLRQAAEVRWRSRAAWFQARARQVGWEQSFWEGMFRALGYKHNTWPMVMLAESRAKWLPPPGESTPLRLQARLFGLSGLLPAEVGRREGYMRGIWDLWWRDQNRFESLKLPRSLWKFGGVRPANHPQRRIALSTHWLSKPDFLSRLEVWFVTDLKRGELVESLNKVLRTWPDDFWSWHWTFRSARLARPQPLIGSSRITDLALNAILPWFWVRAREGGNLALEKGAEERFFNWPKAQDNAVLKLARQRLLGPNSARAIRSAAMQQGLMQIVRDYCDHSNAVCENCEFPGLVGELFSIAGDSEAAARRKQYGYHDVE